MNKQFGLQGTSVLVTGGTRGIGRAISLQLSRAGANVIANYARNDSAATALADEATAEGLSIQLLRADLTLAKGLAEIDCSQFTGSIYGNDYSGVSSFSRDS